jgi:hypothetical protein
MKNKKVNLKRILLITEGISKLGKRAEEIE